MATVDWTWDATRSVGRVLFGPVTDAVREEAVAPAAETVPKSMTEADPPTLEARGVAPRPAGVRRT